MDAGDAWGGPYNNVAISGFPQTAGFALHVGVGFGIRDAQTARAVAKLSDAVVIGSRLVQEIETSAPQAMLANVRGLVNGIRKAIDE